MDKWRTIKLDDGLDRLIDYRGKSPPKSSGGIPVISAKCVKNGRIVQPIEQTIEPSFYPVWMVRGLPLVGDVIMTTEGPLGEVAQIDKQTVQFALGQRVVCMRGRRGVLDNAFLKFLLMSPIQQGILSSYSTGTTVAGVSQKSLRSMPIRVPPYDEQVEIGQLLGALDDKIELHRHMNETLEAMARAIFKDWFVDFGPTRAKIEGRAPYLAPEIWALFADGLDDEGKPEGWTIGTLGDIAVQVGIGARPSEFSPETPYIGLEHMPRRSVALDTWEGAGKVTSGKLLFRRGDFLFGKLRPYFHKVGIAPIDGICSTDIVALNAKVPEARSFVLACIASDEFVSYTDRTSDGTKMPRTSWGKMQQYPVILPKTEVFRAYDDVASPLLERIIRNIHETRSLAATRDLLLPKLMSGEIRVKEAEKLTAEVA